MYQGQQIVEAIFRQTSPNIRRKIGNIEFDANGAFHFVGNPDSYEGVRGYLAFQGVYPEQDPLEAAVIVPADLKNGTAGGEGGTGKVRPPSEVFTDLDDVSGFVKAVRTDGKAEHPEPVVQAAVGAETGVGQGSEGAAGQHPGERGGSDHPASGTEGGDPQRDGLGSEDQVTEEDWDFA